MECTHEGPRPFRACVHLLAAEIPYVARYSGNGMDCDWVCDPCAKGSPNPIELRDVCEQCRDRAKEGGFDSMVGTPGIVEAPSALRFEHRPREPLAHPQLVDAQPVCAGDRDLWIGLTAEGELWRLDLDRRDARFLARADVVAPDQPLNLHLSRDAGLAAVVQRRGRIGVVIDLATGQQTMRLDRSDYHEEHCAFSIAFVQHGGRDLVVHATEWNRLDISDARTGELITVRAPPQYRTGEPNDPHYLDYFHCGLSVSPDQTWIIDNGWAWHPIGIVIGWRLDRWLSDNIWESEDGPTRFDLTWRDGFWDGPLCWLDDDRVCVWGYGDETLLAAVQIHELSTRKQRWFAGPRGELVFDRVLVALDGDGGSTAWDVDAGTRLMTDAHPAPARFHPTAKTYLSFASGLISSRLCGHLAREPWNTGAIAELAATIASERSFGDLPVLGDALEAAGCSDRELLDHCQQPGDHGDGCWVLDRLRCLRDQK